MNWQIRNALILTVLFTATFAYAYFVPKPEQVSQNLLAEIHLPERMADWRSLEVDPKLDFQKDDRFNFIGDIKARLYATRDREQILMILIDGGNFHHPKVCFEGSGFSIVESEPVTIQLEDKQLVLRGFTAESKRENFLVLYWMVVDGKAVDWTGQKWKQLLESFLNEKKAGMMVRLDIPLRERTDEQKAFGLTEKLLNDLCERFSPEEKNYFFGIS